MQLLTPQNDTNQTFRNDILLYLQTSSNYPSCHIQQVTDSLTIY